MILHSNSKTVVNLQVVKLQKVFLTFYHLQRKTVNFFVYIIQVGEQCFPKKYEDGTKLKKIYSEIKSLLSKAKAKGKEKAVKSLRTKSQDQIWTGITKKI